MKKKRLSNSISLAIGSILLMAFITLSCDKNLIILTGIFHKAEILPMPRYHDIIVAHLLCTPE